MEMIYCFSPAWVTLSLVLPAGKQATSKEELSAIHWVTFTGVLGQEVNGIWEKYTDTNDVNAVDTFYDGQVAVTGDDFGLVKLFKFPCLKKGELIAGEVKYVFFLKMRQSFKYA